MADGLVRVDRAQPIQRHLPPVAVALLPVERRLPALALHGGPAIGEPELRALVPTIRHELQVVPVGGQARGQPERLEELPVTRPFVVEGEAVERVAGPRMPDPGDAFREGHPLERRHRGGRHWFAGSVDRGEGVLREDVLDVHQHELLVLLLMVQPQGHARRRLQQSRPVEPIEQRQHVLIDVSAVRVCLLDRGPRDQAALGSAVPRPHRVVVGVEQVREPGVVGGVLRIGPGEQECLEEPAHVGDMPLGGADVRHGLDDVIFGDERLAKLLREAADLLVPLDEPMFDPAQISGGRGRGWSLLRGRGHRPVSFCALRCAPWTLRPLRARFWQVLP